ncbi:MAG: universal stress protein [Cyanobacteria bacterium P01_A01_bin.135]
MFNRILVALDHSERDDEVYCRGRALAEAIGAELLLLHVLDFHEAEAPYFPSSLGMEYSPDVYREAMALYWQEEREYEQRQLMLLRNRADSALAGGVVASIAMVKGTAGPLICRQAKAWQANLIIVGSRGRSSIQEILLGSVSQYVNHHAPCSVLIVHPVGQAVDSEAENESVADEPVAEPVEKPVAVHTASFL